MRTQVGIIGAGPAGLLLSQLLHLRGIESVIVESRSREAIEATIRAGVLEQGTVDLMTEIGAGERLKREGFVHHGFEIRFGGQATASTSGPDRRPGDHRLCPARGAEGPDQAAARRRAGRSCSRPRRRRCEEVDRRPAQDPLHHQGRQAARSSPATSSPAATAATACAAQAIPEGTVRKDYFRVYPGGWFGILAKAPPSSDELIYAHHERGFALVSTRSPSVQRLYFQCDPTDRSTTGRTTGSGPSCMRGVVGRRLPAQGRRDLPEGHHPAAQLRLRADAARPAVPRRRRRALGAADRRQGPESRRRRRACAGPGARRLLRARTAPICSTTIPRPRCGASGGRSGSPGT